MWTGDELIRLDQVLRRAEDEGSQVVSIAAVRQVIGSREQVLNHAATRRAIDRLARGINRRVSA